MEKLSPRAPATPAVRAVPLTQLQLSRDALRTNLRTLQRCVPGAQTLVMVKGNAYGVGSSAVVSALRDDVGAFGCATLAESLAVRAAAPEVPVVVMQGAHQKEDFALCVAHRLSPVVYRWDQVQAWVAWLRATPELRQRDSGMHFWVKLNSGMNRLGFGFAQAIQAVESLRAVQAPVVLMSHLGSAMAPMDAANSLLHKQLASFRRFISEFPELPVSLGNSPAALQPACAQELMSLAAGRTHWLRLGAALYGINPLDQPETTVKLGPVAVFSTTVLARYQIRPGDTVGYEGRYAAPQHQTLIVLSAGYADGYPRDAKQGTPVQIITQSGARVLTQLVGRVSMDTLTVVATDPNDEPRIAVGDTAILWGDNPTVNHIAQDNGLSAYELMTRISARVQRVVVESLPPAVTPNAESTSP